MLRCSVNSMKAERIESESSPAMRTNFTSPACSSGSTTNQSIHQGNRNRFIVKHVSSNEAGPKHALIMSPWLPTPLSEREEVCV